MRVSPWAAALLIGFLHSSVIAYPQSDPGNAEIPQSATIQPGHENSGELTFRVTTREVVLDFIALDEHGRPVPDLTGADLRVSYFAADDNPEKRRHGSESQPQIAAVTSLLVIDPNAKLSSNADKLEGFQITASCLERSTLHYQLTFRTGQVGWSSGFHQVSVTTTRRDIRLVYRHRYFIGATIAPPKPPVTGDDSIKKLLVKDACYYPDTPLSLSLRAHLIDSGRKDVLRYQVALDASSLSYLTLETETSERQPASVSRRVQIDYGICAFNAAGSPIGFVQQPLDEVLTSADYAHALARGFPKILELQTVPTLALTRIVVRDRATGNLGGTDVAIGGQSDIGPPANSIMESVPNPSRPLVQEHLVLETAADLSLYAEFNGAERLVPPKGPIGSFGSIVPEANSFCGDVYELKPSTLLPDFRELDPIGSLYTHSLDVPDQFFINTDGIPGVTPRTNLFGIDYHAAFWIRDGGDYQFRMISDDGSVLWIDDRKLINLDGLHQALGSTASIHLDPGPHTIHIPYYQGAITSVALLLWVRQPGEKDWQIFDLRNFPASTNSGAMHADVGRD